MVDNVCLAILSYILKFLWFYIIAPSEVPSNIQISTESPYSIRLSWEPPPIEQQNGRLIHYHVFIQEYELHTNTRNRTIPVLVDERNITFSVSESRTQTIDDLLPNHNYTIRIAAATGAGTSPFSTAITVTTPKDSKSCAPM